MTSAADIRQVFGASHPGLVGVSAWATMREYGRIQGRLSPSGAPRFELDFRKEARSLGLPERAGRIYSIPGPGGSIPIRDLETARDALHHIRVRVAQGEPLEAVLDSFRPTGTYHVIACAERWIEDMRRRADAGEISHHSIDQRAGQIEHHWREKFAGVGIHELRTAHLYDWATELQLAGLHPGTVRGILAGVRAMMRWLKRRQEIHAVPDFPPIKVPDRAPQLLTMGQQTAVLQSIPVGRRGIFLALADLWLRPSEARALRPEVFEAVRERAPGDPAGWMTIKRAADGENSGAPVREWTKTGRVRMLPVSDRLAEWIAEHVPRDARLSQAFLFPSPRGKMWAHGTLKQVWVKASKEAGVPVVPVREGTRHSSATAAREKSPEAVHVIQKMLGHSDLKTTERYSHHKPRALVQLVRRGR